MPPDLLADARGLLTLAALLLLPGLLVVRAPWTAVPFLSAGFWVLTWYGLPSVGRERFLTSALVSFSLLALLRLRPPWRARWPTWPAVLVLAAAVARLLPFFAWPTAPGAEASFHAASTLLMEWRDGLPATYEPLFSLRAFSAYPHGGNGLAADVALLSGLAAHRASWLVRLGGEGLLQIALYGLVCPRWKPEAAALGSVAALALARVRSAFEACGEPFVLGLAFGLAAAGLVTGRRGWPSAAAGGFLLAAAVACHPIAGAVTVVALVMTARPWTKERAALPGLAAAVGLVAGLPFLLRVHAVAWATGFGRHVTSLGLDGALRVSAGAAALALAPPLVAWLLARRNAGARLALAVTVLASMEVAWRDGAGRLPDARPGPDDLAAMSWIRTHTPALGLFCGAPGTASVWVPALAHRSLADPWVPFLYRHERGRSQPCDYEYRSRDPSSAPGGGAEPGSVVFGNATVVVTSFHSAGRTPVPPPP